MNLSKSSCRPRKPKLILLVTKIRSTIFVVDEASLLLEHNTANGISFFRCFQKAFDSFKGKQPWLLFVVMATYSSITALSPGFSFDASFKLVAGSNQENEGPLDPFILGASFQINSNRQDLLRMSVKDCHQPSLLYSVICRRFI